MPSLGHLQSHQPWTIPYSTEFQRSRKTNAVRQITHDLLHVMKAVGRMAAECEKADHVMKGVSYPTFRDNLPDLVICALHIAQYVGVDLETEVIATMERHNGVQIPPEE